MLWLILTYRVLKRKEVRSPSEHQPLHIHQLFRASWASLPTSTCPTPWPRWRPRSTHQVRDSACRHTYRSMYMHVELFILTAERVVFRFGDCCIMFEFAAFATLSLHPLSWIATNFSQYVSQCYTKQLCIVCVHVCVCVHSHLCV